MVFVAVFSCFGRILARCWKSCVYAQVKDLCKILVYSVLQVDEKRSDVVLIMSDIIFPTSDVVFPVSDVFSGGFRYCGFLTFSGYFCQKQGVMDCADNDKRV